MRRGVRGLQPAGEGRRGWKRGAAGVAVAAPLSAEQDTLWEEGAVGVQRRRPLLPLRPLHPRRPSSAASLVVRVLMQSHMAVAAEAVAMCYRAPPPPWARLVTLPSGVARWQQPLKHASVQRRCGDVKPRRVRVLRVASAATPPRGLGRWGLGRWGQPLLLTLQRRKRGQPRARSARTCSRRASRRMTRRSRRTRSFESEREQTHIGEGTRGIVTAGESPERSKSHLRHPPSCVCARAPCSPSARFCILRV